MKANLRRFAVALFAASLLFAPASAIPRAEARAETAVASKVVKQKTGFNVKSVPKFKKSKPYVTVNGNDPYFTKDMLKDDNFEKYSPLDSLGRCGVAAGCLDEENMPDGERKSISSIKPSGWHTYRYKGVSGGYLYNRCHLIGYQLSAENANRNNLITGTRFMNVNGMLPFENMVADYIEETGNHVLYRVTPVFKNNDLVAHGVLMEAESVEDGGEGVKFNVYCYNNQPGVKINYGTGTSSGSGKLSSGSSSSGSYKKSSYSGTKAKSSGDTGSGSGSGTYVYSASSDKYHYKWCRYAKQISSANYRTSNSKDDLEDMGYEPCKACNP